MILPYSFQILSHHISFVDRLNSSLEPNYETIVDGLIAKSIGKLVVINGYALGNFSTEGTILKRLSRVPLPKETVRAVCNVGSDAYSAQKQGYIYISSDGDVTVKTSSGTAASCYVSLSYIGE